VDACELGAFYKGVRIEDDGLLNFNSGNTFVFRELGDDMFISAQEIDLFTCKLPCATKCILPTFEWIPVKVAYTARWKKNR
jgi:hypothetical protein